MRLIKVQVGPLAASDDDAVSVSQVPSGAGAIVIDGAYSAGYSATLLAAAQARGSAGDLTLTAAAGNLGGRSVVIACAGNSSGITFTVKGTDTNGAYLSETLTGANTSRVATRGVFATVTAITASGAATGNVSAGVNGIATMDTPRRLLLTTSADDTGDTFTITGTDWNGNPISETLAGVNNTTAFTKYDYKTITAIWTSGASSGTIKFGTNGVASSRPIFLDRYAHAPTALQVDVSGTANFTVQQTLNEVSEVGYTSTTWINHPDSALAAATASAQGNYAYVPAATRITVNSQTNPGYVVYSVMQASGTVL